VQKEDAFDKGTESQRRHNLRENGATDEEINILVKERVELNAMTSDQLVAFVERKLTEYSINKVVPDKDSLVEAYRVFERGQRAKELIEEELAKIAHDAVVPDDIEERVEEILTNNPELRWTEAVQQIAAERGAKRTAR
jgi:hypothetical protein